MSEKTSPWVYVGCGCALLAVGMVTAIGACGMLGWREIQDLEATMNDPVVREQKVLEMLGADTLPEGLYAQFYLRIPFFLDLAMVSDIESEGFDSGHHPFTFDQQMLSVLDVRDFGGQRARFRQNLEDERVATDALDNIDTDLGFRGREVLGRGELAFAGWTFVHQLVRGESSGPGRDRDGVAALGEVRCDEDDGRLRMLIWFRADEAAEEVADARDAAPDAGSDSGSAAGAATASATPAGDRATVDLGSPHSEDDIRRLLGSFAPCPKS